MKSISVFIIALAISANTAAAANVTFVSPLEGSQAIGPALVEVTTDATNVNRVEFYVDGVLAGIARKSPWRIAFDFGTTLTSRTITAKVLSNGYRTTDSATIATMALTAGESINVDLVEVPLRVRSSRALTPGDLALRENGVVQTIRDIRIGRAPAHFAFIVDRSSSMTGGKLTAALRAVAEAKKLLRGGDTHSLTLFNHTVVSLGAGSPPRTIVPSGGTSLRDAVARGVASERTYAIVITDGSDRNSLLSEEQALRRISGTKTILSAVILGSAGEFLEQAAKNTGGTLIDGTRESVVADVRRIIEDINSRYTLVYQSHGTKGGWRSIAITPRRGVEILASRKGYFSS